LKRIFNVVAMIVCMCFFRCNAVGEPEEIALILKHSVVNLNPVSVFYEVSFYSMEYVTRYVSGMIGWDIVPQEIGENLVFEVFADPQKPQFNIYIYELNHGGRAVEYTPETAVNFYNPTSVSVVQRILDHIRYL